MSYIGAQRKKDCFEKIIQDLIVIRKKGNRLKEEIRETQEMNTEREEGSDKIKERGNENKKNFQVCFKLPKRQWF
jgi:site-specific DNA-adenine methylase